MPSSLYMPLATLSKTVVLGLFLAGVLIFPFALWAAARHGRQFMIGSVVLLTLVPIYGLPDHSFIHPAVLGLTVIAFASLIGLVPRRRFTLTIVDVGALIAFAGCALSVALGHQIFINLEIVFLLWFCPYFAARSITGSGQRTAILRAVALAGAVAIPFGIVEIAYGNVFIKAFPFGTSSKYGLGVPMRRLGIVRAEGAFGQPIPYAMFLTIAAVAAVTLWLTRTNRGDNRWLYLGLSLVALQATSLARTGWLMLAVVAAVVLALNANAVLQRKNRRLIVLAVLAVGVALIVPKTNELILGTSGTESKNLAESADYRSRLLHEALEPGYFNPYGTTEPQIGPGGIKSIDDEYIHAAWTWGYLPIMGFAVIFLGFALGAWRNRKDVLRLSVYATCIATAVALESVAFITQQEVLIWLLWGCASGLTVQPARRRVRSHGKPINGPHEQVATTAFFPAVYDGELSVRSL